ncbi:MAG: hypothetical protein ABI406_01635 [Ktedonobacteraceae bacterium]
MNNDRLGDNSSAQDISRQQVTIVTQLYRTVPSIHHIDELFQWLAYAFVQRFDVQLVQFWMNYVNQFGQPAFQLRTAVSLDPSLPQQIAANDQVAFLAQRIASERRRYNPQLVDSIFPYYQANILRRFGLIYCSGFHMSSNTLMAPLITPFSQEPSSTLFAMSTLLFFRQTPHIDVLPSIAHIMEQAVGIAGNRSLLLPAHADQLRTPQAQVQIPAPLVEEVRLSLAELVPRRKQDDSVMLSSNPFASATIITDKQARRLYAAIDGHVTVADICDTTGMNIKEVGEALQKLLAQQRVELHDPEGHPVNASFYFPKR